MPARLSKYKILLQKFFTGIIDKIFSVILLMLGFNSSSQPDKDINDGVNNANYAAADRPDNKIFYGPVYDIVRFCVIALIIIVPIRLFIAQPFIVSGESMGVTFYNGEYLIVDQISYRFDAPERGDVIIFRYPKNPSKFFIKRVIGLPGDTVTITGNTVSVTNEHNPDGVSLSEPYVQAMNQATHSVTHLGLDEYFVLGDNRNHSSDSRTWGILPKDNIIGQALVRLFPLAAVDMFPGGFDINAVNQIKTELKNQN